MSPKPFVVAVAVLLGTIRAFSQGTFIYDQQSATEATMTESQPNPIQSLQPIGQSFTPSLSAVGFVRLWLGDYHGGNGQGATVLVNLLSDSITGTVIGTSQSVTMPDNFGNGLDNSGYVDFVFSMPVAVTPGTAYYIQPVVQSGDLWGVSGSQFYNYPGGVAYGSGTAFPNYDLWFREGIIVPEPSTWALLIAGGGALFLRRRKVA